MALRPLRLVSAAALGVLLLAGGGCGGQEPGGGPAVDRTAWKPTFEAAMDALARRDRRALEILLTPQGRITLERDLANFSKMLADPLEGPRQMLKIRGRWPEVPDDLVVAARGGDPEAAWGLFLGASTPAGVRPKQAGMRLDAKQQETMHLLYRYGEGRELRLVLRRIRSQWAVDEIELGA